MEPAEANRRGTLTAPTGAAAAIGALLLAFWIHAPALEGEFLSDDHFVIVANPYVHAPSARNLRAILDPAGAPAAITVNYAPVHLLLHAAEWQAFGKDGLLGWHVVNVLAHVAATAALVAFFLQLALPPAAALGAGALFLVHPANVEAVAWIFQLKTIVATLLATGALLAIRRRPALALTLFALALLTKITAAFALPVALARAWCNAEPDASPRCGWLAGWGLAVLLVLVAEFLAFGHSGDTGDPAFASRAEQLRSVVGLSARYAVMMLTASGLSTFHETPPARAVLDPWWLAGLVVVMAVGWRIVRGLRLRDTEAVFWIWLAAAFVPISQLVPFPNPMADRYVYGMLPGLLGAGFLAFRPVRARVERALGAAFAVRLTLVLLLVVVASGSLLARERAGVYRDSVSMMRDSAGNYPLGMSAALVRLDAAAARRDGATAARALASAIDQGHTDLAGLLRSPGLASVRDHPAVFAQLSRMASNDVAQLGGRDDLFGFQRFRLALALDWLGRTDEAIAVLEPAQDDDGPFGPVAREFLRVLREDAAP